VEQEMSMTAPYEAKDPPRAEIDALPGATVLEFGTNWCGICRGAQPHIEAGFSGHEDMRHLKFEDGADRKLGRTFKVKLWPTLVFMKDGAEVARVVRPQGPQDIARALDEIAA
jgi:thioredoxin 1